MGKAAVIGGVSGALSFGIGKVTSGLDFATKASLQAGMHGVKGGIMAEISGDNFKSGFYAGAVSSLVASSIDALGINFSGQGAYRTITGEYSRNAFGNSGYFKAAMIASGGLSGGLSSRIAGGNFWSGVRQGLITSGLNHAMHAFAYSVNKNQFSSLKDYEQKISDRLSKRISEVSDEMVTLESKIKALKADNANTSIHEEKLSDLNNIVQKLLSGCRTLEYLINESHGYNISLKYGTMTDTGRLEWGSNNRSLVIRHDGSIDTIIHEMIHVYDVISKPYRFAPFQANSVVGAIGYWSEVNAWKMEYALKGRLKNVYRLINIDKDYIKSLGY